MPRITYRPFDRLDPMLKGAPTRHSPRLLLNSERAKVSSDKDNDAPEIKNSDRRNEANKNRL